MKHTSHIGSLYRRVWPRVCEPESDAQGDRGQATKRSVSRWSESALAQASVTVYSGYRVPTLVPPGTSVGVGTLAVGPEVATQRPSKERIRMKRSPESVLMEEAVSRSGPAYARVCQPTKDSRPATKAGAQGWYYCVGVRGYVLPTLVSTTRLFGCRCFTKGKLRSGKPGPPSTPRPPYIYIYIKM